MHGFSGAGSFGLNAEVSKLQFVSTQATYNWDCCGNDARVPIYTLPNVRNENLWSVFNVPLANNRSFGSLRHAKRACTDGILPPQCEAKASKRC